MAARLSPSSTLTPLTPATIPLAEQIALRQRHFDDVAGLTFHLAALAFSLAAYLAPKHRTPLCVATVVCISSSLALRLASLLRDRREQRAAISQSRAAEWSDTTSDQTV